MSSRIAFWSTFATLLAVVTLTTPRGDQRDLLVAAILALGALAAALLEIALLRRSPRLPLPGPATAQAAEGTPHATPRILLASVFLGRDGRAWTEPEIESVLRALRRAIDWLLAEAAIWGVTLQCEIDPDLLVGADSSPRDPSPLEESALALTTDLHETREQESVLRAATRVAASLNHTDLPTLAAARAARNPDARIIWFLHSLSQGRSQFLDARETGVPGLWIALCYVRERVPAGPYQGPTFADPVTYVHELLHAFGATDKYGGSTRQDPPGEVSDRDVMLLHHETLARLRIDPKTAREIGWLGAGPPPRAILQRNRRGRPTGRRGE